MDFSELMVVLVIALIVVGPQHFPKVARTIGHLRGRAQRYINSVKTGISRNMAIEEIHKLREPSTSRRNSFMVPWYGRTIL